MDAFYGAFIHCLLQSERNKDEKKSSLIKRAIACLIIDKVLNKCDGIACER